MFWNMWRLGNFFLPRKFVIYFLVYRQGGGGGALVKWDSYFSMIPGKQYTCHMPYTIGLSHMSYTVCYSTINLSHMP